WIAPECPALRTSGQDQAASKPSCSYEPPASASHFFVRSQLENVPGESQQGSDLRRRSRYVTGFPPIKIPVGRYGPASLREDFGFHRPGGGVSSIVPSSRSWGPRYVRMK